MSLEIRPLTQGVFDRCPDDFVAIGQDVPGEYWTRAHFQIELPMKWHLSQAAWAGERLVGYAILSSRSPIQAHLHHFMVIADCRGRGFGEKLLNVSIFQAAEAGHALLTLKVAPDLPARRLYERAGFAPSGEENGYTVYGRQL